MQENRKALCQYMTPNIVADLVARYVPDNASKVIDLAAGQLLLVASSK